jgi:predicted Zn-dependent peptidase
MKIAFMKFIVLLAALAVVSGCATVTGLPDPRAMTFPPLKFDIPKSERLQLKNGMTVYIKEDRELPLVNVTAYIRTGSIYEPDDKIGLAGITGSVLRSGGSEATPPEKMDAELEFMASAIESGIHGEAGNVSMATLSKNLDRTLELFAQVLRTPAFREDRLDLARKQSLEGLRRQNDDPKGIAGRELQRALYAGHPLGRVPTVATISSISRQDLLGFHNRYFRPGNIMLAVSGDFDKTAMIARLEKVFADWENRAVELPLIPPPSPDVKPEVLLARKDVSQSVIRMGELGIDIRNPDLYALRVLDYILGGGFTSRLTNEIRSNQGLAYNASSYLDPGKKFVGTFVASTETKSESTARAVSLMREIIGGVTKELVTEQELKLAKDSIINSFIFGFTRIDAIVNQQLRLEYYGYPAGYLENYRDNIARVTREDLLRVAGKYLHPDRMVLMVVGNDAKFDQSLAQFGPVREIKLDNSK